MRGKRGWMIVMGCMALMVLGLVAPVLASDFSDGVSANALSSPWVTWSVTAERPESAVPPDPGSWADSEYAVVHGITADEWMAWRRENFENLGTERERFRSDKASLNKGNFSPAELRAKFPNADLSWLDDNAEAAVPVDPGSMSFEPTQDYSGSKLIAIVGGVVSLSLYFGCYTLRS